MRLLNAGTPPRPSRCSRTHGSKPAAIDASNGGPAQSPRAGVNRPRQSARRRRNQPVPARGGEPYCRVCGCSHEDQSPRAGMNRTSIVATPPMPRGGARRRQRSATCGAHGARRARDDVGPVRARAGAHALHASRAARRVKGAARHRRAARDVPEGRRAATVAEHPRVRRRGGGDAARHRERAVALRRSGWTATCGR